MQELQRRDIHEIHARLQSTWRLLWDEQLNTWSQEEDPEVTAVLPEFGMRWRAVSNVLGFAEHRLGRWVTQIGCWWRHGRYRSNPSSRGNIVNLPFNLIVWRYLRELVKQSVMSGCSGPSAAGTGSLSDCFGAGFQCKSRRSGVRGEHLPAPFRNMIGPCTKPFERQLIGVITSKGCRPPGNVATRSQSVLEFNRLARGGARKVIELVALGALQPVELVHPLAWRFAAGDIDDFLRQAFDKGKLRWVGAACSSNYKPEAWLRAPGMSMGGVLSALSFGFLEPLGNPAFNNIWEARFTHPFGMRPGSWAQQAMHDAVLPSLEGRAREASLIAQSFLLGGTKALHANELELFCGMPPLPASKDDTVTLLSYESIPIPTGTGIPQSIAWRQGFLYDSELLIGVAKNSQQEPGVS